MMLPSIAQCHHAPGGVCVLQVGAAGPYPLVLSELLLAHRLHSCLSTVLCLRMYPLLESSGWRHGLYCRSSVPRERSKRTSLQLLVEKPNHVTPKPRAVGQEMWCLFPWEVLPHKVSIYWYMASLKVWQKLAEFRKVVNVAFQISVVRRKWIQQVAVLSGRQ